MGLTQAKGVMTPVFKGQRKVSRIHGSGTPRCLWGAGPSLPGAPVARERVFLGGVWVGCPLISGVSSRRLCCVLSVFVRFVFLFGGETE